MDTRSPAARRPARRAKVPEPRRPGGGDWPGYRQARPLGDVPRDVPDARAAWRRVLRGAGASLARDAVDRRLIADVRAGRGRIIDSQAQVGGWPDLRRGPAVRDRDGDGLPDAVERRFGGDPAVVDAGAGDRSGYPRLERLLEERLRDAP